MVKPVTGRSGITPLAVGQAGGAPVAWSALPMPQPGDETRLWAFRQFQELEDQLAQMREALGQLQAIVGDGSWDGGGT